LKLLLALTKIRACIMDIRSLSRLEMVSRT